MSRKVLKLPLKKLKSLTKLWLIALSDFNCISPPFKQLFDQRWHKIMLGVTDSRAKLWVDCQPVKSIQGNIEYPLRERGQYDTHDGYLSIAQIADTRSYQVRIARQFMMTLLLNRWLIFSPFHLFSYVSTPVSTSCEFTQFGQQMRAKKFLLFGGSWNQRPLPNWPFPCMM